MKAILFDPTTKELRLGEHLEPRIQNADEVKLKVIEVGICGTDRHIAQGATPPPDEKELIIGHEMFGKVVEIGRSVSEFRVGDFAVVTVRRGCESCISCRSDRPDMCYLANYTERGIKGRHGFQCEYVVDHEKNLIKVPDSMQTCGVLCEPMSVIEKAIEEIITIQKNRLDGWSIPKNFQKKQVLVVGVGPIGLLACIALKLRGFQVFAQDIVPADSARAKLVEELGCIYIDGRMIKHQDFPREFGPMEIIVEAAGVAEINFQLLYALSNNGGCVLTGIPDPNANFPIAGGHLMQNLVLKNQVLLGSVNAGKKHWELAIQDLQEAQKKWPETIAKLITSRVSYHQFKEAISNCSEGEIKTVITWGE